jgi:Kef-type K+ transport system membrane component KefB
MFQIGLDFEFSHLSRKRNRNATIGVAAASVSIPLALGVILGQLTAPILAPGMNALIYSLFFGVGLAITAVPVLGRILREFDLAKTEIGVVAISAAALNDAAGWLLLAGISTRHGLAGGRIGAAVPLGLVRIAAPDPAGAGQNAAQGRRTRSQSDDGGALPDLRDGHRHLFPRHLHHLRRFSQRASVPSE